jgi:hypothetical protein
MPCVLKRKRGVLVWKTCHKQQELPRSASRRCVGAAGELTIMLPQPSRWRSCVTHVASNSTVAKQITGLRYQGAHEQSRHVSKALHSPSHLHVGAGHGKLVGNDEFMSFFQNLHHKTVSTKHVTSQ